MSVETLEYNKPKISLSLALFLYELINFLLSFQPRNTLVKKRLLFLKLYDIGLRVSHTRVSTKTTKMQEKRNKVTLLGVYSNKRSAHPRNR